MLTKDHVCYSIQYEMVEIHEKSFGWREIDLRGFQLSPKLRYEVFSFQIELRLTRFSNLI